MQGSVHSRLGLPVRNDNYIEFQNEGMNEEEDNMIGLDNAIADDEQHDLAEEEEEEEEENEEDEMGGARGRDRFKSERTMISLTPNVKINRIIPDSLDDIIKSNAKIPQGGKMSPARGGGYGRGFNQMGNRRGGAVGSPMQQPNQQPLPFRWPKVGPPPGPFNMQNHRFMPPNIPVRIQNAPNMLGSPARPFLPIMNNMMLQRMPPQNFFPSSQIPWPVNMFPNPGYQDFTANNKQFGISSLKRQSNEGSGPGPAKQPCYNVQKSIPNDNSNKAKETSNKVPIHHRLSRPENNPNLTTVQTVHLLSGPKNEAEPVKKVDPKDQQKLILVVGDSEAEMFNKAEQLLGHEFPSLKVDVYSQYGRTLHEVEGILCEKMTKHHKVVLVFGLTSMFWKRMPLLFGQDKPLLMAPNDSMKLEVIPPLMDKIVKKAKNISPDVQVYLIIPTIKDMYYYNLTKLKQDGCSHYVNLVNSNPIFCQENLSSSCRKIYRKITELKGNIYQWEDKKYLIANFIFNKYYKQNASVNERPHSSFYLGYSTTLNSPLLYDGLHWSEKFLKIFVATYLTSFLKNNSSVGDSNAASTPKESAVECLSSLDKRTTVDSDGDNQNIFSESFHLAASIDSPNSDQSQLDIYDESYNTLDKTTQTDDSDSSDPSEESVKDNPLVERVSFYMDQILTSIMSQGNEEYNRAQAIDCCIHILKKMKN